MINTGPLCDDLYRREGVVMILENVRGFSAKLQGSAGVDRYGFI
jgi:hypothetical protein